MNWTPSADATMRIVNATDGVVECMPRRKRVAIVGFASSSRDAAPWLDPAYELWGLNQGYQHFQRRPDRWFELHQPEAQADPAVPTYFADLSALAIPIYMVDVDPRFGTSVKYPLDRVRGVAPAAYGRYFTSTMAYLVALALAEGFEEIAIYGVDCTVGTEYADQKPCLEAWLGLAMGRGVTVTIPPTSALMRAPNLYGYEPPRTWPRVLRASEQFLRDRIEAHKVHSNEALADVHRLEGAIQELSALLSFAESKARGAQFPTVEPSDG